MTAVPIGNPAIIRVEAICTEPSPVGTSILKLPPTSMVPIPIYITLKVQPTDIAPRLGFKLRIWNAALS